MYDVVHISRCDTKTAYIICKHILHVLFLHTSRAARGGGGSFKNRKRIGEIGCCESRMTKRKH